MLFNTELVTGILNKRYKRFLADVVLGDGSVLTAYCPNTGSMRSCSEPGSKVLLSRSENLKRKYPYTLEMICSGGTWVGVNTGLTNRIVVEAIKQGKISELGRVEKIFTEVKVSSKSRLDVMVQAEGKKIYIEVKNCSLAEDGIAMFPDAVTARGTKHLHELAELVKSGHEGMIFYLVQRGDAKFFKPAAHIDPVYADALRSVCQQGVKMLVYQAAVGPRSIEIVRSLPFSLV
jgi:sugar fermentation stimulation protein A